MWGISDWTCKLAVVFTTLAPVEINMFCMTGVREEFSCRLGVSLRLYPFFSSQPGRHFQQKTAFALYNVFFQLSGTSTEKTKPAFKS